jgi:hypothetical protein
MPYIDLETDEGMKSILTAPVKASIVSVTTRALHENAAVEAAITGALAEAIERINSGDPEAIAIIARHRADHPRTGGGIRRVAGHPLRRGRLRVDTLAEFMTRNGYIENPISADDACWSGVNTID